MEPLEIWRIRCSFREILADVLAATRKSAASHGIRLEHEYEGPPPGTILTDPVRARQVLTGLIGGAVRLTTAKTLHLSTRLEQRAGREMGIRFDVIDPVTRLSEKQIDRLLRPLGEARKQESDEICVADLELSISKRLAQLLGGNITIEPLAEGTRYRLGIGAGPRDDAVASLPPD
jgi:signal transduction histidine kinase